MITLQFSSFTPVKIQAKHIHIAGWDRYDHKYSPKFPCKFPRTSLSNTHQVPNPISLQPPVNQYLETDLSRGLYPLTKRRSEGAIPIASNYRLIDSVVSNCINSNINKIYALTQFNSTSLNSHLSRAYSGAGLGKEGFVEVIAAYQSPGDQGWFQGTADAIRKCMWVLEEYPVAEFLILPGHHLYKMDYQKLIESHRNRNSDVTIVASNSITAESLLGSSDSNYRCIPSMGIYLINRATMLNLLNEHFPKANYFGTEVIRGALSLGMKVEAYLFEGYWENMRSIEAFYQANMDCIKKLNMGYNFCDRDSPVYTMPRCLPPTIVSDAIITDSVIGDGCILHRCKINGTVVGMRTKIGDGTIIEDSVIMGSDVYQIEDGRNNNIYSKSVPIGIGKNTEIRKAIVDKNARIGNNVKKNLTKIPARYQQIINKDNVEEGDREANGYIISGKIMVVLRSAEIPDDSIL
ncbi:hypothetical protein V6N13_126095 [Hibiscus sabdariffa]